MLFTRTVPWNALRRPASTISRYPVLSSGYPGVTLWTLGVLVEDARSYTMLQSQVPMFCTQVYSASISHHSRLKQDPWLSGTASPADCALSVLAPIVSGIIGNYTSSWQASDIDMLLLPEDPRESSDQPVPVELALDCFQSVDGQETFPFLLWKFHLQKGTFFTFP